ncbi:MAG: hypothetical protein V4489_09825 [Chlamydiota bacterium]
MNKNEEVKMVKRKICKNAFIGSWKGQPLALIPKYRPDTKPGDYIIEEMEIPANHPTPRILDPKTTPLSIVKEICRVANVPFFWITEVTPETLIGTIKNTPITEAIEYFLVFGTSGTTLAQYRRIFNDLINGGVINLNMLVTEYLNSSGEVEATALKFSPLENCKDKKKKNYNYNDKIHNMLKSFHLFLRNPHHFTLKYKKWEVGSTEDDLKKQ